MSNHGALRAGFRRYVMSVQYHGSSFLGFTMQPAAAENCILPNGTDVRGYVSVERRIRLALSAMLHDTTDINQNRTASSDGDDNTSIQYENIQVSSRTDRGVHAIKNTFHVDIRVDNDDEKEKNNGVRMNGIKKRSNDNEIVQRRRQHLFQSTNLLLRSMNYYLRQTNPTSPIFGLNVNEHDGTNNANNSIAEELFLHDLNDDDDNNDGCILPVDTSVDDGLLKPDNNNNNNNNNKQSTKQQHRVIHRRCKNDTQYYCGSEWVRRCPADEVQILAVQEAPLYMSNTWGHEMYNQDPIIDWNVRFSAISRTYVYRIMYCVNESAWGLPFEWDRSWRVYDYYKNGPRVDEQQSSFININDMRIAASYLIGSHDFSSFRGASCQRHTPVMTLSDITIHAEPYDTYERLLRVGNLQSTTTTQTSNSDGKLDPPQNDMMKSNCYMITIRYVGDSFLYRQVRKMTGCLIAVGRGKMLPSTMRDILMQKDPAFAPYTAPPQGLYLVDVKHEGMTI